MASLLRTTDIDYCFLSLLELESPGSQYVLLYEKVELEIFAKHFLLCFDFGMT